MLQSNKTIKMKRPSKARVRFFGFEYFYISSIYSFYTVNIFSIFRRVFYVLRIDIATKIFLRKFMRNNPFTFYASHVIHL